MLKIGCKQKQNKKEIVMMMTPREIVKKWVDAFNKASVEEIIAFYDENAVNHQVANPPVVGRENIKKMFQDEFSTAEMVCIPENIFEDGEWAILEWKVL